MEKRKSIRKPVHGDVKGRMVLARNLEIMDLSLSGMRFRCIRKIDMHSIQSVNLGKNNISLKLRGIVVRSTLKSMKADSGKKAPFYEVALNFSKLSDDEKNCLETIIRLSGHE